MKLSCKLGAGIVFLIIFCWSFSLQDDSIQPQYFQAPPFGPKTTFSDLIQKFSHFFNQQKKFVGGARVLNNEEPKGPQDTFFFETAQLPKPQKPNIRQSLEFEQTTIGIDLGGAYVNGRVFKFNNAFRHLKIIPPATGCQGSAQPSTVDETVSNYQQQIAARRTTNFFSSFVDTLLPKLPPTQRMEIVEKTVQSFFSPSTESISSNPFDQNVQNSFFPLTTAPFCKVATNSGFFVKRNGKCLGNIITDGKILQWDGKMNVNFGITENGQVVVGYLHDSQIENFPDFQERRKKFSETFKNADFLPSFKFLQLWQGVIWLVRKGEVFVEPSTKIEDLSFQETGTPMEFVTTRASRMSICVNKKNEILLAIFDGDGNHLKGPTLFELAEFMKKELDCVEAANLDGGGSTTIVENDKTITSFVSDNCKNSQIFSGQSGKPWERCRRGVGTVMCFHDYFPLEDHVVLNNKELLANISATHNPFNFEKILKANIIPKKEAEISIFMETIEKLRENAKNLMEKNNILIENYENFRKNTFSFEIGQNIILFLSIFANLVFLACFVLFACGYCSFSCCGCFGSKNSEKMKEKVQRISTVDDDGPELELPVRMPNDDDLLEDEENEISNEKGSLLKETKNNDEELKDLKDEESAIKS